MTTTTKNLSVHAQKRSQQRGIRPWALKYIMEHADKVKYAGNNCISQFISKRKLSELCFRKVLKPSEADLLNGVVVIAEGPKVITVFHKKIRTRTR